MKINFDKIFIGVLWLLTATLATTFWMNTKYSFNIFSSAHWAYLSELQAQRAQISTGFYVSLIFAVIISVVVLYVLVRPHFRKIPMPGTTKNDSYSPKTDTSVSEELTIEQSPTPIALPKPETKQISTPSVPQTPTEQTNTNTFGLTRPVSPMAGITTRSTNTYQTAPITNPGQTDEQKEKESNEKITEIFGKAGYIIKKCSNIGDIKSPAFAIGYDQSVWIGITNKSPDQAQGLADTLIAFFADTLGETAQEINVHVCVINPTENKTPASGVVHLFSTLDELDTFMAENKNKEPEEFEPELFEAFSSYIDTVTNYIGKQ